MVCYYVMIAVSAWYYMGQPELEVMLSCPLNVAQALAGEASGEGEGNEGGHEATELAVRLIRAVL